MSAAGAATSLPFPPAIGSCGFPCPAATYALQRTCNVESQCFNACPLWLGRNRNVADRRCHNVCAARLPTGKQGALELHMGQVQRVLKVRLLRSSSTLLQVAWIDSVQPDPRFRQLHAVQRRISLPNGSRVAFISASRVCCQRGTSRRTMCTWCAPPLTPSHRTCCPRRGSGGGIA